MEDKFIPPPPKQKPYRPAYSREVYAKYEENYPDVPWREMSLEETDAWISMSTEGAPPYKLPSPDTGQDVAKGGLIKKKKKKMRHGGVHTKRPQMMNGGAYKGKSHAYAAGGKVIGMKLGK